MATTSTRPLILVNEQLCFCPLCLEPLWSWAWNQVVRAEGLTVFALDAHCQECNRWWVVGYSREVDRGV